MSDLDQRIMETLAEHLGWQPNMDGATEAIRAMVVVEASKIADRVDETTRYNADLTAELIALWEQHIREDLSEFYRGDTIEQWLHAEHKGLGGRRAIDLIRAGDVQPVLQQIASLQGMIAT